MRSRTGGDPRDCAPQACEFKANIGKRGTIMRKMAFLLIMLTASACSQASVEQALRPTEPAQSEPSAQPQKWQGLVVTDNPYMLSSDRLEKMNKGGFGGY